MVLLGLSCRRFVKSPFSPAGSKAKKLIIIQVDAYMHALMNTKDFGKQVADRRHLFIDLFIAKARLTRLSAYSPIYIKGSGIIATSYASRLYLFTALNYYFAAAMLCRPFAMWIQRTLDNITQL
jgi:hypothetical protein